MKLNPRNLLILAVVGIVALWYYVNSTGEDVWVGGYNLKDLFTRSEPLEEMSGKPAQPQSPKASTKSAPVVSDIAPTNAPDPIAVQPQKEPKAAPQKSNSSVAKDIKSTLEKLPDNGIYELNAVYRDYNGYGIQVALYRDYDKVVKHCAALKDNGFEEVYVAVAGSPRNRVYKIVVENFAEETDAIAYNSLLSKEYKIRGFVVNLRDAWRE